jgi:two-component system phosphate regulon response regulator OmpR
MQAPHSAGGRVLVVDDDRAIRAMLVEYLSQHGYALAEASDGATMRAAFAAAPPDVVLLDLNLPGEDGFALARWLRERHAVGIIMVTGAADVVDRVVGLEIGADDYIAKPFDLRELRARLRSLMRRLGEGRAAASGAVAPPAAGAGAPAGATSDHVIAIGRQRLDTRARRLVDAKGNEIPLTSMEFDLLRTLVLRPNQVLSRDQLLNHTRNRDWEPFDRSIDIRITRLRRKIEPDPARPRLLRTVRGAGYMYCPDPAT